MVDPQSRHPRTLAITSFNLRYPAPGRNPWRKRLPVAAGLLTAAAPHIIGTQEGVLRQLEDLSAALEPHYSWLGEGREGGDAGEFTAIFYDSRRICVDAVEVRWLSDRPDVAGSVAWGARTPRTVTIADCIDMATDARIRFINTHLDHRSARARLQSAEVLVELAREASGHVVLVGDFNVDQNSEIHTMLTADAGLRDSVEVCPGPDADISTFHGYKGPRRESMRIDWILASDGLEPIRTSIDLTGRGSQYPSDHFPVHAEFEVRAGTA